MPLTIIKPPTEAEAAKLAKPELMPDGVVPAHIERAYEDKSKKTGRDMIVASFVAAGREFTVYLNTSNAGLLLLRHACIAVGAEAKFNAGTISAEDISGHDVLVRIGTERKRGWPARNVILDVMPAESAGVVTPLRAAG